jgi:bacillithiol system protein YtxJ
MQPFATNCINGECGLWHEKINWNGIGTTTMSTNHFMQFIPLEKQEQLEEIKSAKGYNVIFKHNTTCSISKGVRNQFEEEADSLPGVQSVYFLDLLKNQDISNAIAEQFNVKHQSPQLLLIKDGECTYNEALYDISADATANAMAS